ncbi:ATPase [candidate division KSB3 bacterium]|uniref:Uncharacterized AAA domain-containing protein ycf46 n=1 Tax=candidate division KSB3 bacterium TaxID=2044937 RepID=A0A2G6E1T1_9BACT|nr:MAG: ATPase [candidate division KSB3 bacterium]PIE28611.1 MAG: ATPase [candidate division KSB3 bacterium]
MANLNEYKKTLGQYLKARIPFITIRTKESTRALEGLRDIGEDLRIDIYYQHPAKGILALSDSRRVSEDRALPIGLDKANEMMSQKQNVTFVFCEVYELEDESDIARSFRSVVQVAEENNGSVVVITNEPIWTDLQSLGMTVILDTPDEDEILQILESTLLPYKSDILFEWTEKEFQEATSVLTGLMKIQIESILYTMIVSKEIRKDDIGKLVEEKDKIFSDISGIERVRIPSTLEVGGLENLRNWLALKRPLLTADLRERQMRSPRGVLLVGVPGCGKSLSAKTIASQWKMPLYRLDLANIQGQYVGQSESRLKAALEAADNVSPCVLWIDEIEKGFGGLGSDSTGVTTRLLGHFLFWLQESVRRVFVVATANNVGHLPPELLRRGRFDELFFVDLPSIKEREQIIRIYWNRYLLKGEIDDRLVTELAKLSEGFAGSDLESAIKEVGEEAFRNGDDSITEKHFIDSFKNIVPLSKTSPEQIEQIRIWGNDRAIHASGKVISGSGEERKGRRVLISTGL